MRIAMIARMMRMRRMMMTTFLVQKEFPSFFSDEADAVWRSAMFGCMFAMIQHKGDRRRGMSVDGSLG